CGTPPRVDADRGGTVRARPRPRPPADARGRARRLRARARADLVGVAVARERLAVRAGRRERGRAVPAHALVRPPGAPEPRRPRRLRPSLPEPRPGPRPVRRPRRDAPPLRLAHLPLRAA